MSAAEITPELLEHHYQIMPQLAGAHTGEGIFRLLETLPGEFPGQSPEDGFIPAFGDAIIDRELPPDVLIAFGSVLVSNTAEIITELQETADPLIQEIEALRFDEGKNVLWVGNHPEVDSIMFPMATMGLAMRQRSLALDRPTERLTVMAKPLAWYGVGTDPVVNIVRNISNVVLTAPGTESGVKIDPDLRAYINDHAVPHITERLDRGMQEMALSFSGSTDRLLEVAGRQCRIQYTASDRTADFLLRDDVVVIPFATHRPDDKSGRMFMAIGAPRPMDGREDCVQLGKDIAHLSYRASGIPTVQTRSRKHYRELLHGKSYAQLTHELRELVHMYQAPYEDGNGDVLYLIGRQES